MKKKKEVIMEENKDVTMGEEKKVWAFPCDVPGCNGGSDKGERGLASHKRFAHGPKKERSNKVHVCLQVEQLEILIDEWGTKTIEQFADDFGVSTEALRWNVHQLRRIKKADGSPAYLCPEQTNVFKAIASDRGLVYGMRAKNKTT